MKKIGILILISFVVFSCINNNQNRQKKCCSKEKEIVQDGVFIHISEGYNDPHRVLMPLKMANMMADDKDVLVYLDIHAVEFLIKGAKDLTLEGFESGQTYIDRLIKKGVGVYVCPTCLNVAGLEPNYLIEGIQTAQKDKFFNFTKGRIITLDY